MRNRIEAPQIQKVDEVVSAFFDESRWELIGSVDEDVQFGRARVHLVSDAWVVDLKAEVRHGGAGTAPAIEGNRLVLQALTGWSADWNRGISTRLVAETGSRRLAGECRSAESKA